MIPLVNLAQTIFTEQNLKIKVRNYELGIEDL